MSTISAGRREPMQHSLQLEQRRHALITGVTDVCSFHETEIVLKIESGVMILNGENLHIGKLLLDDGKLDVEGQIDSVLYERPKAARKRLLSWMGKAE